MEQVLPERAANSAPPHPEPEARASAGVDRSAGGVQGERAAAATGRPVWRPRWLDWTRSPWGPILLGLVIIALDQITKWAIVQRFASNPWPYQDILGDMVRLTYTRNSGAAFGLFPDRTIIFTVVAIAVVPLLLWGLRQVGDVPIARLSLGLLLGGTVGNLIDRVMHGSVVDFIDVGLGDLRWPAFNVADSAFVVGTIIMVVYILLFGEDDEPARPRAAPPGPGDAHPG